jgi:uncharacterized protein YhaN
MEVQFEDGINTFVQDNGWGKSTLAAFIRVMLYGFDGETKRNDIENERKRYRPSGGDRRPLLSFSQAGIDLSRR